ncbi:trypsin-like peptidase domain-containing protein [Nocardioides sp. CN2-186]|uniref:S1C family serine protease n=1 Tax=Nocardioides tweenelious TaxID=3156607 RepID=UPI0032B38D41
MTTPDSPPPPYSPYDPYRSFAQAAAPAPETTTARRRPWRGIAAGAVAGGVLAASIAVPSTWALTRADQSAATPTAGAAAPQQVPQEGLQAPQEGTIPSFPGTQSGQDPYGQSTSDEQSNATDAQSQGVVLINTTLTDGEAAGTGLVLDSSGIVLTNYHVVEGSTSVKVTIASDGTTYDATVVGHDQKADIAVLQLDGASGLATVNLDDDDEPAVSDAVTAVGNAQGQGYLSASDGSVVALDQSINTQSEGSVAGERLTGLIETNAYVVGGYSGGALLDAEGEVVGITTAASSGGVTESYAVPIDDALTVADAIESGQEGADVEIGPSAYLGIGIASDDLQIASVETGSAAASAGIAAGDTLTSLDGTTLSSYDELHSTLAGYAPGDKVTIGWTDTSGRSHTASVTLGTSPIN